MADPVPHSIEDFRRAYEDGTRLRGFRSACGFVTATWGLVCPQCQARDLSEVDFSGRGRISAFTIQNVPGEEFLNDAPYAYVVVEMAEGGRLTGWIEGGATAEALAIGTPVRWAPSYKPGVHFQPEPGPGDPGPHPGST